MEEISRYSTFLMVIFLVILSSFGVGESQFIRGENYDTVMGNILKKAACDEIYVVREGETLNTISEKCGDPFIVEENPHINDPDDVFPGLVIKITPYSYYR
ncbi:peptidoglycan-binding LysM domain-containing protein [Euphorbia peplus]|nr:peptidoglycan-binding LysM domain-containing protein [Euphorbia peplus]